MHKGELAALLGRVPRRAPYRKYLMASYADNTKRAYQSDIEHFKRWGGRVPSTAMQVAQYLAAFAGKLAYATLSRRLAAIHHEHVLRGSRSPARTALVRATLRGIARTYSRRQRQVKPLLREQIAKMLPRMRGALGTRDRAVLLMGFLGGFRRSELASLDYEHITLGSAGMVVTISRSKTDQEGLGRAVTIPRLMSPLCPTKAVECWLKLRGAKPGPLFTAITPMGAVTTNRLSGLSIAEAVKRRVAQIGLDPRNYSGHSLRSGFVTSAARAGASAWQIKQQTGHKSDAVLARYIREGVSEGASVVRLVAQRLN